MKKLTKDQESRMQFYVDKWLKIGLSTGNETVEETEKIIDNVYEHLLLKKLPKEIKIFENPLDCWKAVSKYAVENQVENQEIL